MKKNAACRIKLSEMSRITINIRVSDSSPHPPSMTNRFWICGDGNSKNEGSFVAIHPKLPSAPHHKARFIRCLRAIGHAG